MAILPWGDLIDDFLDGVGLSLEDFAGEMTGGWLFGYVEALRRAGLSSVIVCFSARYPAATRLVHRATGAPIVVIPPTPAYRAVRRRMINPYGWTVTDAFGESTGARRRALAGLRHVAPYLATPVTVLARALRAEGCSAVLCQEYEYPRFDACVAAGRLLGVPVFATFQGGTAQISGIEQWLRPATLRACAGLIVGSAAEAERVVATYGLAPAKVARIPNPLDADLWSSGDRPAARVELGVEEDADVVVWHGRVDIRNKGLDVLLEAWRHLQRLRPGRLMRLVMVGTGRDAPELRRRLAAAGPDGQGVVWLDRYLLDRAAMARHLSAGDVYAFPSRIEGFPVAPIEAMACGLPVVAADGPGVAEIAEGGERSGASVVPVGDAVAFAEALARLLDDPGLRREMGRRARRRVEEAFSMGAVGARLAEVVGRR